MKKLIVIFVIILFLITNLSINSIGEESNQKRIIYVDDDNTEGPWDGSWDFPFKYIQDAIDNASDGYIISVMDGMYYENITIDKSLELYGDPSNSIIHGVNTSKVVSIDASDVKISGFIIENASKDGNNDYCVSIGYKNCDVIVNDCLIRNFTNAGIVCWHSSNYNKITGNQIVIEGDVYCGILQYYCIGTMIERNFIKRVSYEDSQHAMGVGIELINSYLITVRNNHIWYLSRSIDLYESLKCDIGSNNMLPSHSGIGLFDSSYNNLFNNDIFFTNYGFGISISDGIANNISFNDICGADIGMLFYDSSDNTVYRNNFETNNIDATFYNDNFSPNIWEQNYWGKERVFPKIIIGQIGDIERSIRWFNVDWHPATEPYEI